MKNVFSLTNKGTTRVPIYTSVNCILNDGFFPWFDFLIAFYNCPDLFLSLCLAIAIARSLARLIRLSSVVVVVRHNRRVGVAPTPDRVTEISVVKNPSGDGQDCPEENVVQTSRAKLYSAPPALMAISPPE